MWLHTVSCDQGRVQRTINEFRKKSGSSLGHSDIMQYTSVKIVSTDDLLKQEKSANYADACLLPFYYTYYFFFFFFLTRITVTRMRLNMLYQYEYYGIEEFVRYTSQVSS